MAFAEDTAVFLDPDEHGEPATYTPQGGGPVVITVIFQSDYVAALGLVQTQDPAVIAAMADVPNVKSGDAIVVRGQNYTVALPEKNWGGGLGFVLLRLEEV